MTNTTTEGEAYVTLVTSDAYVVGALVLAQSLRRSGTTRPLVCLATSYLAADCVASLRELYDVRFVAPLDSGDEHSLRLLGRPELGPTFTKIQLWTMTDLKKAVFLDADMMVLKNIDDLFEREEFSACADVGWPDCFNSGLFVCQPNLDTFNSLLKLAQTQGSFDGGDQGLLNSYFSNWTSGPSSRRIPFTYNLTFNACYSYLPAFERNKNDVRAVHFIGSTKPWHFSRFSDGQVAARGDGSKVHLEYVQMWWDLHDEFIKPKGYNPHSWQSNNSESQQHIGTDGQTASDFANYRIKWTDDVESFFQKKVSRTPSRKTIVNDESEDERNYDPERRLPIPKPTTGFSR